MLLKVFISFVKLSNILDCIGEQTFLFKDKLFLVSPNLFEMLFYSFYLVRIEWD